MEKINENSAIKGSGLRYHFTDIAFSGSSVTFNVYVNSLVGTKNLYQSGIQLGYNPAFFGANIATNGNLQLTQAGISLSNAYNLSASNVGAAAVKIELLPVGTLSGYTSVGTSEQLLAKGKIVVQNPTAAPNISYNLAQMQSMSKYFEAGVAKSFDTVVVDGDWKVGNNLSPSILDFYPKTVAAGIRDTITIIGTDFGITRGTSRIQFINASKGENPEDWISAVDSQYIFWSDTKIKVVVPSICESGTSGLIDRDYYAGTGKIRIRTGPLPWRIDNSDDTLHVRFCVNNIQSFAVSNPPSTDFITELSNINLTGGYSLYYSKALKNLAGGVAAFERALISWRCATLVNFSIKDSTSITNLSKACRIDLTPLPIGTTTTLAQTAPFTPGCSIALPTSTIIGVGMGTFSISFNKDLLWHTGVNMPPSLPANTYDFESTAVHELGHAHLLKHSNNHEDLMYFTNLTPPYRRQIESNDLAGGLWVVKNSKDPIDTTGNNCKPAMIPIDVDGCAITTGIIEEDGKKPSILIYPSIFSSEINIRVNNFEEKLLEFQIFNLYGQLLEREILKQGESTISLNQSMANGLYICVIRENGNVIFSTKIIKQ